MALKQGANFFRSIVVAGICTLIATGAVRAADPQLPPLLPSYGEQRFLVILYEYTDLRLKCTPDDVRRTLFASGSGSVSDFFRESSYGQVWLSGAVFGPLLFPDSQHGPCQDGHHDETVDAAARAAGAPVDAYTRKIYVQPRVKDTVCESGGGGTSDGGHTSRMNVPDCRSLATFVHEAGHSFGIGHASRGYPPITTLADEYGDDTDIMGLGRVNALNAPHRIDAGWLDDSSVFLVERSGRYHAVPLSELSGSAASPRVLKLFKADSAEHYYLSYRIAAGFDAAYPSGQFTDRTSVHQYGGYHFVNLVPLPGRFYKKSTYFHGALGDGQSFVDAVNQIRVIQISHNRAGMTVQIDLGRSFAVYALYAQLQQLFADASQRLTRQPAHDRVVRAARRSLPSGLRGFLSFVREQRAELNGLWHVVRPQRISAMQRLARLGSCRACPQRPWRRFGVLLASLQSQ